MKVHRFKDFVSYIIGQSWDSFDMQSGHSGYTGQGHWRWSCQERKEEEDYKGAVSEGGQRVGVTEGGFWQQEEIEMICCKWRAVNRLYMHFNYIIQKQFLT